MNKKNREILLTILVLFVILGSALAISLKKGQEKYELVIFGDSIMAGLEAIPPNTDMINEISGMKVLYAGFPGLTMSEAAKEGYDNDYSYFFSMVQMSKQIKNRDLSAAAHAYLDAEYLLGTRWKPRIKSINEADWESIKYVVIEQGVNDYFCGAPIDNEQNRYDASTFCGALRTSIENLQACMPEATFILQTPTYCYLNDYEKDCTEISFGGGFLSDYVAAELEVAKEYNLAVIDNYNDQVINKDNVFEITLEGLHPEPKGSRLLAERIVKKIEELDELTSDIH